MLKVGFCDDGGSLNTHDGDSDSGGDGGDGDNDDGDISVLYLWP